jgi:hypothetical protein
MQWNDIIIIIIIIIITFVGMLTYSRPDMFFWIACFNVFKSINSNIIIK